MKTSMFLVLAAAFAALMLGAVACQKVTVESPACDASASANGGGGGGGSATGEGGPGAPGSAASSAGCTPGKASVEQAKALGSGFLPSQ